MLAVFNGEKYLAEQIDSILNQTISDIKIVIRDDGSSDSSPEIIKEYAEKFADRITLLSGKPTGGAKTNFSEMLKAVDDDYIMFSDQDDVWFPTKAQITLDKMLKVENCEREKPVLVHTDLKVTDKELKVIAESFFAFQKIYPDNLSINRLLVQNYVTGCTIMINRALKNRALPMPTGAVMHDWWLALTAAVFGKTGTVFEPTLYYRQHGGNEIGAKAGGGVGFIARKLKTFGTTRENVDATYRQAKLLLEIYGDIMPDDKKKIIKAYTDMASAPRIKKICMINEYNFKKCTRLRVLGQYLLG